MAFQGNDRDGALYDLAEKHGVLKSECAQNVVISAPVNELVTVTVTYVATTSFFKAMTGQSEE